MPTPYQIYPTPEDQSINWRMWAGVLLPPLAGGINTLVGYMVSNYDCNVHNRHLVMLVNVVSLLLCVIAAAGSLSARRRLEEQSDERSGPLMHTRRFMLHLGFWFAAGFFIFICAGTASTFLLRPCDL